MTILEAIILGLLQGVTEFFPISSSGHLVIAENLFQLKVDDFFHFSVFVHIATLLAVIIYFRNKLLSIAKGLISKDPNSQKLFISLIIATLPAILVALTLNDFINQIFNGLKPVLFAMIFTGLCFIIGESIASKIKKEDSHSYLTALIVGIVQSIAIIPGISRSGSTVIAGMLTGKTREQAAEFSFLMAIPAICGAGLFAILDAMKTEISIDWGIYLAGFVASFLAGYASIYILMKLYQKYSLLWFAIYLLSMPFLLLLSYA